MRTFGVGIVGCGNVSSTYFRNTGLFPGLALRACADLRPEAAAQRAGEYGCRAESVEALLAAPDVDIIINLTVPNAHFDVSMAALAAGKHVYTEKPLAATAAEGRALVAEAARCERQIASAPDTILGAGGRAVRRLIDEGAMGKPVAGTAFFMSHGMEHWHPNPEFFFKPGGGPVLDMGPYYVTTLVALLGPVARVRAVGGIGQPERIVTAAGPHTCQRIAVETPTTIMALLEFARGPLVAVGMSWDVWAHGNRPIELHGTEGSLRVPDPNFYGGVVELSRRGADWEKLPVENDIYGAINWPFDAPKYANYRMLAVAELADAIAAGRRARMDATLALHVLEVLEAMLRAAETGGVLSIPPLDAFPAALSEEEARRLHAG